MKYSIFFRVCTDICYRIWSICWRSYIYRIVRYKLSASFCMDIIRLFVRICSIRIANMLKNIMNAYHFDDSLIATSFMKSRRRKISFSLCLPIHSQRTECKMKHYNMKYTQTFHRSQTFRKKVWHFFVAHIHNLNRKKKQ